MTPQELKNIRKLNGLNQRKFAQSLGLSQNSISGYEKGKTKIPKPVEILIKDRYLNPHIIQSSVSPKHPIIKEGSAAPDIDPHKEPRLFDILIWNDRKVLATPWRSPRILGKGF